MRKVLSFVLVLSLILGSFSMAFAAAPAAGLSDIAGSANAEAIQVSYDLGIVTGNPDGTFLPTKAVTRAEFAAMITRALAIPDSALAGYTATTFKDTAGYGWAVPYLAFANSKGIMLGDGAGNAMPGKTISVNEAVTMALRAIGYTNNSAELVGAWPSNYVTLAQNLDLYDDVAAVTNVDKANAAQIIYNLLTVEKVSVNADGDTKGLDTTLLESGLGAEAWEDPAVIVGDEDSKINLRPYVGAAVIAYEKSGDIIAIGSVESTFLTVDKITTAGSKFKTADGTEYTYSNTTGHAIFANGARTVAATTGAFTAVVGDKIAVELKGKTVDKLWSVSTWSIANGGVAALFEDGDLDLEDGSLMGEDFTLDDDDNIDYTTFELFGVASLEDIDEDNVVYVYTASNEITKVTVGTEVVKGKITKTDADSKYYIDGKGYKYDSNGTGAPVIGETGTALLNYSGKIFDWDADDATSGNYAMVTKAVTNTFEGDKTILFTKEGTESTLTLKSDATVTSTAGITANDLVIFSLNKDGKIDKLTEKTLAAITGNGKMSDSGKIFDGKAVADGVVVFVKNASADYDLGSVADIDKNTNLTGAAWYFTNATSGKIEVIVVNAGSANSSDSVYGVLNKIELAVNADDDDVNYLTGFVGGKEFAAFTDAEVYAAAAKVAANGGLIEFEVDADGIVTNVVTGASITTEAAVTDTIAERDGNLVKLSTAGIWVALDPTVVVYQYDGSADAGAQFSVKSVAALKAGQAVKLYQVDDDSEVYDVVIFDK